MTKNILLLVFYGITSDFLFKYIEEGELPNFERIVEMGAMFRTEPVLNSVDVVTRTSAFSGLNPGKFGIFDTIKPTKEYTSKLSEVSSEIERNTVARLLRKEGKKAIVIDEQASEIEEKSALDGDRINEERFLEDIYQEDDRILKRTVDAMQEDWHYIESHFCLVDRVQHVFYRCIDEKHPAYTKEDAEKYGDEILKAYMQSDENLCILMKDLEESALFVFSDKGIAPVYKHVNINNFLAEKGVITLKEDDIDWEETLAYPAGAGQIRVNLKGREAKGIVEQGKGYEDVRKMLIKLFENMMDQNTGEKVVERVFRMEELYSGLYLENSPDLVLCFRKGYAGAYRNFGENIITENRRKWSADHASALPSQIPGILIACGSGIKRGEYNTASIMDLAPTVLYYSRASIPNNMDGKVLEEMFETGFLKKLPRYHEVKDERKPAEVKEEKFLSDEEEEEIKERLRALGYLA